jgi:hypothetical protein
MKTVKTVKTVKTATTIDAPFAVFDIKPVQNVQEWLTEFARILTKNALDKFGLERAFECCDVDEIVSIRTEDTGLFGITHKISVVSRDVIRKLLVFLDQSDAGNRVQIFDALTTEKNPDKRLVVNVLCNLKKFSEGKITSPSNSFVTIDYFNRNQHEGCSCC